MLTRVYILKHLKCPPPFWNLSKIKKKKFAGGGRGSLPSFSGPRASSREQQDRFQVDFKISFGNLVFTDKHVKIKKNAPFLL